MMHRTRARGMTLAEAVISIGLLSLCLVLMAELFAVAHESMDKQDEINEGIRGLAASAGAIASEVDQAVVGSLAVEEGGQALTLVRLAPPDPPSGTASPTSAPTPSPARLARVRFSFAPAASGGTGPLCREIEGSVTVVNRELERFQAEVYSDGSVGFVLADRAGRRGLVTFSQRVAPRLSRLETAVGP